MVNLKPKKKNPPAVWALFLAGPCVQGGPVRARGRVAAVTNRESGETLKRGNKPRGIIRTILCLPSFVSGFYTHARTHTLLLFWCDALNQGGRARGGGGSARARSKEITQKKKKKTLKLYSRRPPFYSHAAEPAQPTARRPPGPACNRTLRSAFAIGAPVVSVCV